MVVAVVADVLVVTAVADVSVVIAAVADNVVVATAAGIVTQWVSFGVRRCIERTIIEMQSSNHLF